MSYFERAIEHLAMDKALSGKDAKDEAFELYLALSKSDLRLAIRSYADLNGISIATAVAEACRSYFVGE